MSVTRASSLRSDIEVASLASGNDAAIDEKKRQATTSAQEDDTAPSSDSDIGDEEQGPPTPAQHAWPQYSKLRLLSLVLTVTGAAFLNVPVP